MKSEDELRDLLSRVRALEIALFGRTGNFWHEKSTLPDGTEVGTIGAITHIINNKGFPISKGFHSIESIFPKMDFEGTLGANTERFTVDVEAINQGE